MRSTAMGNKPATPRNSTTVDVEAIARTHKISAKRWPTGAQVHAAMLEAERQGAGSRLRAWMRRQGIYRAEDSAWSLGRARGTIALEQGKWPPPPIRGSAYGKDDFLGVLASLEEHPVVAELLALAWSWPEQMQTITNGRFRYWFDDGRIASLARNVVHDHRSQYATRVLAGAKPTPALARQARDAVIASAERQLRDLRQALDPSLYDPRSSPKVVYPKLCEVSTDAARRVLEELHGVEFDWGREGRDDASALCQGETTLEALADKAAKAAEQDRREEAERLKRRAEEARALLRVHDDAASRGEVNPRRFNLAYWRAHPEISKYQRSYRGLSLRSSGGWSEATLRGPGGHGFHAKVRGSTNEAIAALFESLRTEAGVQTSGAKSKASGRRDKTAKGRSRRATKAAGTAKTNEPADESSSDAPPQVDRAPGSLWSTEQEGFALVSPRGEGQRVQVPTEHQPMLIDLGKPDREAMEAIRERELTERRGPRSEGSEDAGPLLVARPETPVMDTTRALRTSGPPDDEPEPRESPVDSPAPTARLEYVDIATGVPTDPSEPGTLSTGRIVAEVDGETVEVDEEDLVGRGDDPDPRKRRYRFDADSPADYRGQAKSKKAARSTKSKKTTKAERSKGRRGLRKTFDSAAKGAAVFYEHNADFLDHVHDPWDGLRDWMDGIEVRVGRGHRKLAQTAAGKKILGNEHAAIAIRGALAYLLGKAKGRRWESVSWDQVERLGHALERYYEAPSSGPGQPGLYWRPFTGQVRAEDLEAMPPAQRVAIREQESAQEIGERLEELREAYGRAKACLPKELRRVVERRIAEWSRWVDDPTKIPDHACEPDPLTAGYLCNYPSVAGELTQLRRSCEEAYDPNWAAEDSKKGLPGYPDTSAGEDELPIGPVASAKACCSSKGRSASTAGRGSPVRAKKTCGVSPRKAKPKTSNDRPTRPKSPARKTTARSRRVEARKATAERKKAAAARREQTTAERRASRLACSAAVAKTQAKAIDTRSYLRRVDQAKRALDKAATLVAQREQRHAAQKTATTAVLRDRSTTPRDRQRARSRLSEARCQLRHAQGAQRQRQRDLQRATTELQRAQQRVLRRETVAAKRRMAADDAQAKARALARKRR